MFSEEEAKTNLDKGFRGRPSIGSVVMANSVNLDKVEPWKTLQAKMKGDAGSGQIPKIMIFGSIFGGTGAAGFPTIARLLKNWTNSIGKDYPLQIGGVLCLPYFSFDDSRFDKNELHVKSENLVLNTQAALRYYQQQNFHENINVTYLLGADDQRQMPVASTGSSDQKNPAHWIELCAALAAIDFYRNDNTKREPYQLLARQSSGNLLWSDLPDREIVQDKLLHLARFSFAFLSDYYPRLRELYQNRKTYRATWYVHFFENKKVNLANSFDNELKFVKQFCEKFLFWFANIQYSVYGREVTPKNLIDYSSFAIVNSGILDLRGTVQNNEFHSAFDLSGFANIVDRGNNLTDLLKKMNESRPPTNSDQTAWSFINTLYRNCAKN